MFLLSKRSYEVLKVLFLEIPYWDSTVCGTVCFKHRPNGSKQSWHYLTCISNCWCSSWQGIGYSRNLRSYAGPLWKWGPIQGSGDVCLPSPGLVLSLREGWVDTSPETTIDPKEVPTWSVLKSCLFGLGVLDLFFSSATVLNFLCLPNWQHLAKSQRDLIIYLHSITLRAEPLPLGETGG